MLLLIGDIHSNYNSLFCVFKIALEKDQPSQNVFAEQVKRKVASVLVPKRVPKGHKLAMFPWGIFEI